MEARVIFLTFGDGSFDLRKSALRLATEARSTNVFSEINIENLLTLRTKHPGFIREHREFLSTQTRGLGYWIWKPLIILSYLEKIQAGDILVYCDAGSEINDSLSLELERYLPDRDQDCTIFPMHDRSVAQWTNKICRQYLDPDDTFGKYPQLASGLIILRSSPVVRELCNAWLCACIRDNYSYVKDRTSPDDESPIFVEHRHDQAIFTLLLYKYKLQGKLDAKELDFYSNFETEGGAIFAARNKKGYRQSSSNQAGHLLYRMRRRINAYGPEWLYRKLALSSSPFARWVKYL